MIKLNSISITVATFRNTITNLNLDDYFNSIKNNFILGGDFNANHQCKYLKYFSPYYFPTSRRKKTIILDISVT